MHVDRDRGLHCTALFFNFLLEGRGTSTAQVRGNKSENTGLEKASTILNSIDTKSKCLVTLSSCYIVEQFSLTEAKDY